MKKEVEESYGSDSLDYYKRMDISKKPRVFEETESCDKHEYYVKPIDGEHMDMNTYLSREIVRRCFNQNIREILKSTTADDSGSEDVEKKIIQGRITRTAILPKDFWEDAIVLDENGNPIETHNDVIEDVNDDETNDKQSLDVEDLQPLKIYTLPRYGNIPYSMSSITNKRTRKQLINRIYKPGLVEFTKQNSFKELTSGPFSIFTAKIRSDKLLQGNKHKKILFRYFLYRNMSEKKREIYVDAHLKGNESDKVIRNVSEERTGILTRLLSRSEEQLQKYDGNHKDDEHKPNDNFKYDSDYDILAEQEYPLPTKMTLDKNLTQNKKKFSRYQESIEESTEIQQPRYTLRSQLNRSAADEKAIEVISESETTEEAVIRKRSKINAMRRERYRLEKEKKYAKKPRKYNKRTSRAKNMPKRAENGKFLPSKIEKGFTNDSESSVRTTGVTKRNSRNFGGLLDEMSLPKEVNENVRHQVPTTNILKPADVPFLVWFDSMINTFMIRCNTGDQEDFEFKKSIFLAALGIGKNWMSMTFKEKSTWLKDHKDKYRIEYKLENDEDVNDEKIFSTQANGDNAQK